MGEFFIIEMFYKTTYNKNVHIIFLVVQSSPEIKEYIIHNSSWG